MIQKGFTLIELMVVVAIIAILAAIGINSYQEYISSADASASYHASKEAVRNTSYSQQQSRTDAIIG